MDDGAGGAEARFALVAGRALAIALAAAVPGWVVKALVLAVVLRADGETPWLAWISGRTVLVLALTTAACFAITVGLARTHRFRADLWWLAGALFVVAEAAATLAVGLPTSGGAVGVDFFASLLSGSWLVMFATGAFAWYRSAPTYVPLPWTRSEPEDD